MARRLISATKSDIRRMTAPEMKESIRASEGRVILSQCLMAASLCGGVSNPELAQAFGADMIFLNLYSLDETKKHLGLVVDEYVEGEGFVAKDYRIPDLRKIIDLPIGIYLECGAGNDAATSTASSSSIGPLVRPDRVANAENLEKAVREGADFIVLGGNPGTRTKLETIIETTRRTKAQIGDRSLICAGKWEDGVHEKVLGDPSYKGDHREIVAALIDAGADVINLPMPGSRQGIMVEHIADLTTFAHTYKEGTLVMNFLDGSVEGADEATVRQCALWSKMTGADIHAIGDAGLGGIATPEDIYQMAITIKGRRLTWRRMAITRR